MFMHELLIIHFHVFCGRFKLDKNNQIRGACNNDLFEIMNIRLQWNEIKFIIQITEWNKFQFRSKSPQLTTGTRCWSCWEKCINYKWLARKGNHHYWSSIITGVWGEWTNCYFESHTMIRGRTQFSMHQICSDLALKSKWNHMQNHFSNANH